MDDTGSPGAGKGRDPLRNKAWWFGYYSPKRIRHQNVQIHMIGDLDVRNILEVGPAGGYVTALLANIGYSVTTLDYIERDFDQPDCPHVQCDLTAGFPALSPMMGLTHGVHGIGDMVAVSVHADPAAIDADDYLDRLADALGCGS